MESRPNTGVACRPPSNSMLGDPNKGVRYALQMSLQWSCLCEACSKDMSLGIALRKRSLI